MDSIEHAERLIGEYRRYSKGADISDETWLADFGSWLIRRHGPRPDSGHDRTSDIQLLTGMYMVSLFNLIKGRMNKFLGGTPFSNVMDYHFLILLQAHGRQTKSDLIDMNGMEMSSGIEIIRRLLRNRWIGEEPNESDKRSTYVKVSALGETIIGEYKERMDEFYYSLTEGMTGKQQEEAFKTVEMLVAGIATNSDD